MKDGCCLKRASHGGKHDPGIPVCCDDEDEAEVDNLKSEERP